MKKQTGAFYYQEIVDIRRKFIFKNYFQPILIYHFGLFLVYSDFSHVYMKLIINLMS